MTPFHICNVRGFEDAWKVHTLVQLTRHSHQSLSFLILCVIGECLHSGEHFIVLHVHWNKPLRRSASLVYWLVVIVSQSVLRKMCICVPKSHIRARQEGSKNVTFVSLLYASISVSVSHSNSFHFSSSGWDISVNKRMIMSLNVLSFLFTEGLKGSFPKPHFWTFFLAVFVSTVTAMKNNVRTKTM